jgi:S1-C subfamily serine protease
MPKKFKQEMKGLGSGMIIDSQGHILINYHVAGSATKIEVTLLMYVEERRAFNPTERAHRH